LKIAAIIPARMGSSRFPGKPLANILGIPMVEHVRLRVAMSKMLSDVYVATCDQEIYDAVTAHGGKVIMTSSEHQRASDRTAEAATKLDADIVVMVQGDEPMTYPDMIDIAVSPMINDSSIICTNLTKRIMNYDEYSDPNTIKVVMNSNMDAMYMSREKIPYSDSIEDFERIKAFKQVCIIPFTSKGLELYSQLKPTLLEISESVDMNRFLEHGYKVKMVESTYDSHAVDNIQDLALVTDLMKNDPLTQQYIS
jgi:3-deoxy-manno-octulosonate cytidylyltransferase (CMP-KDO synthetase)